MVQQPPAVALQDKRLTVYSQVLFPLTLCGLITTCNDIIFCTCRVNWGWNCIDHYGCLLRTTMELMMGQLEQKPQQHTQDKSWWMQSDTFLLQQTPHTNVCNPAVRLKSSTFHCWCHYELAAELFASVTMEKKTSHGPLFFSLLSLHGLITQASALVANTINTLHDFNTFRFFRFLRVISL